jgi:hypothetical protein
MFGHYCIGSRPGGTICVLFFQQMCKFPQESYLALETCPRDLFAKLFFSKRKILLAWVFFSGFSKYNIKNASFVDCPKDHFIVFVKTKQYD